MTYTNPIALIDNKLFTKGYIVKWGHGEAYFLWENEAISFCRITSHKGLLTINRKGAILSSYQNGKRKLKKK